MDHPGRWVRFRIVPASGSPGKEAANPGPANDLGIPVDRADLLDEIGVPVRTETRLRRLAVEAAVSHTPADPGGKHVSFT